MFLCSQTLTQLKQDVSAEDRAVKSETTAATRSILSGPRVTLFRITLCLLFKSVYNTRAFPHAHVLCFFGFQLCRTPETVKQTLS